MTRNLLLRFLLVIVVVAGLLRLSTTHVKTTFNVQADTQIVEFKVGDTHRDSWFFRDVLLYRQFDSPSGKKKPAFSGIIRVLPGTTVNVTRFGFGPLRLTFTGPHESAIVAEIKSPDGEILETVTERLAIVDRDPATATGEELPTVLPFSGSVTLGTDISDGFGEYPALLQKGTVTMLAETLFGNQRYEAGRVSLGMTDRVLLEQDGDAFGLLKIDRAPDMSIVFRVVATKLRIDRVGALGEDVYASPLVRIKNDSVLQGVWAASALVLGILLKLIVPRKEKVNENAGKAT